jgi:membrane protein
VAALFATIYKVLPSVRIAWRDVTVGAVVTAALFTIGKYAIGMYLGNSGLASTYGAAGSIILLLVWVYYSAQILLLGAEFTRSYARHFGSLRSSGAANKPVPA